MTWRTPDPHWFHGSDEAIVGHCRCGPEMSWSRGDLACAVSVSTLNSPILMLCSLIRLTVDQFALEQSSLVSFLPLLPSVPVSFSLDVIHVKYMI